MKNKRENYTPFRKIIKTLVNIISWTCLSILIIIAACLVYYVISAKIYSARGEKYEPPFALYTIMSGSMEPNIKVYDVIVDTRIDSDTEIKEGDVITFISEASFTSGMTITHRVIEVIEDEKGLSYRTKGDNNLTPDSAPVSRGNVIGKVAFKIPQLGRAQLLLASRGGWLILILIPALGIVIYDILKLLKLVKVKDKLQNAVDKDKKQENPIKVQKEQERKKEIKEKLIVKENKEYNDELIECNKKSTTITVGVVTKKTKQEVKKFQEVMTDIEREEQKQEMLPKLKNDKTKNNQQRNNNRNRKDKKKNNNKNKKR